jgi:hypothetical protein
MVLEAIGLVVYADLSDNQELRVIFLSEKYLMSLLINSLECV